MSKSWSNLLKKLFGKSNENPKPNISEEDYKMLVDSKLTTPREFITVAALKLDGKIVKGEYN